jgi:hypothetical protein
MEHEIVSDCTETGVGILLRLCERPAPSVKRRNVAAGKEETRRDHLGVKSDMLSSHARTQQPPAKRLGEFLLTVPAASKTLTRSKRSLTLGLMTPCCVLI